MFELPELFGSPYVLPAIIVVVVLLLLLLLLSVSRRRRTRSAGKAGTPVGGAATGRGPTAATAAAARGYTAGREASDGLAKPATSAARSTGTVLPSDADPVTTVVADLLQGWGDITPEDTNRLRIFRADKVAAAIAATEVPKNLKNSEQVRARLNQLRHYASSLQQAPATGQVVPPEFQEEIPAEETAGEERAAETSWGVEKSAAVADAAVSWYGAALSDKAADETSEAPKSAGGETIGPVTENETEVLSEEQPEVVEEMTAEIVEEQLPEVDEAAEPAEVDEAAEPAEVDDGDSFFSDLGVVVSTADELLALPSAEQTGMLAFLSPAELGTVFRRSDDPELKKSVIDTLENIGNTSSLDVIHDCLDDPDPEIQVYALDAADRLLGVDQ
jgi:hypothetical protein